MRGKTYNCMREMLALYTHYTTYQHHSPASYVGWYSLINTVIPVATHGPKEAFAMWCPLHSYTLGLVGGERDQNEAAKAPKTRHAEILHIPVLRDNVLPRRKKSIRSRSLSGLLHTDNFRLLYMASIHEHASLVDVKRTRRGRS
jgi:hypothetical protein